MGFKQDFMWGGSVSCMQTEGAWNADGKGLSVFDVKKPKDGMSDWKVAIDTYHRYAEDSTLMQELGFNAYRFSISWTRIFPDGDGEINPAGLAFYDRFIDDLKEKGIEPIVCLHHFDLPLSLVQRYGGWQHRGMLEAYKVYAETVIRHFGDKVKYYIPFNEQNACGLITGAMGASSAREAAQNTALIMHHMFLAGAYVCKAVRENAPEAKVGGMINFMGAYAATPKPMDALAATLVDREYNYQTLDVMANGLYPTDLLVKWSGIESPIQPGDLELLREAQYDFFSCSYYTSLAISAGEDGHIPTTAEFLLSAIYGNTFQNPYLPKNEWGWGTDPVGIRRAVGEIYHRYHKPVFILECGIGVKEEADENGYVDDQYRIDYVADHLLELKKAVDLDGVDLMGFLVWAPMDILSSSGEMRKRYGFIYVNRTDTDLKDLKRSKKKSFGWMQQVIAMNGEEL